MLPRNGLAQKIEILENDSHWKTAVTETTDHAIMVKTTFLLMSPVILKF